jgi:antitoxin (DNA-binding transcriptional repressor) of toxin-antitoxin stability system
MKAVGIKVLKNKLSEYVRLASRGETILITDRDEVVAELTQPRAERSPILADALLAEAVRQGWLSPPALSGREPPPETQSVMPLAELLGELDQDREDR